MSDVVDIEEVARRVPTLELIEDGEIRRGTERLTAEAPDYFWTTPASRSDYHHAACQRERGLWAHTLMLSTVVHRLGDSYVGQTLIDESDLDLAHSAAILHDQRKNGDPTSPSRSSVSDHEERMGRVIRESSNLPERAAEPVESHMGPWYDGPEPESGLDQLVHHADMIASTSTITPSIHGPIPSELEFVRDLGVEEVDLDG